MYLRSNPPTRECPEYRNTEPRSAASFAMQKKALLSSPMLATPQNSRTTIVRPPSLRANSLQVARRRGQRFCRSTFTLAFVDGDGAYRETLIQEELADVPVVCSVVVLALVRSDFAVFVVIGAERQYDADFTVAVGQSL